MSKPNSIASGLLGFLTVPPMVFLAKGYLYAALACQLLAVIAYFKVPTIRRYREHIKGFAPFVITMSVFGLVVGLTAYLAPTWTVGVAILWMIANLIAFQTIAGKIKRFNVS